MREAKPTGGPTLPHLFSALRCTAVGDWRSVEPCSGGPKEEIELPNGRRTVGWLVRVK